MVRIMMLMLEMMIVAAVLSLLVLTLVRVVVRLVVGGALALPWGAGGVPETTARMFVLSLALGGVMVGLVGILWMCLCSMLRGSLAPGVRKRGGLALGLVVTLVLAVLTMATVLSLLVMTLVRVEDRLVVGGALALSWGVGGGGLGNHCEDVRRVVVGVVVMVLAVDWATLLLFIA